MAPSMDDWLVGWLDRRMDGSMTESMVGLVNKMDGWLDICMA